MREAQEQMERAHLKNMEQLQETITKQSQQEIESARKQMENEMAEVFFPHNHRHLQTATLQVIFEAFSTLLSFRNSCLKMSKIASSSTKSFDSKPYLEGKIVQKKFAFTNLLFNKIH